MGFKTCSCSCACVCCCCPSNCNTTCFVCPTLEAIDWAMGWPERLAGKGIKSAAIRCMLAEFLGTFLLVAFGVYACGGISGGHINPAVTLAMAIIGRLEWIKVPFYFIGQYLGAFCASVLIYAIYYKGLLTNGELLYSKIGGIWATKPYSFTSTEMAFGDQIFGTFLLLVCVMALTDAKNMAPHKGLIPILVGFVVFGVGLSFGTNAGFAINPARDFGPRLFEAIILGSETFTNGAYYFWIPIVGPHIGAILGALVYIFLIEIHHPVSQPKMSIPLE